MCRCRLKFTGSEIVVFHVGHCGPRNDLLWPAGRRLCTPVLEVLCTWFVSGENQLIIGVHFGGQPGRVLHKSRETSMNLLVFTTLTPQSFWQDFAHQCSLITRTSLSTHLNQPVHRQGPLYLHVFKIQFVAHDKNWWRLAAIHPRLVKHRPSVYVLHVFYACISYVIKWVNVSVTM